MLSSLPHSHHLKCGFVPAELFSKAFSLAYWSKIGSYLRSYWCSRSARVGLVYNGEILYIVTSASIRLSLPQSLIDTFRMRHHGTKARRQQYTINLLHSHGGSLYEHSCSTLYSILHRTFCMFVTWRISLHPNAAQMALQSISHESHD